MINKWVLFVLSCVILSIGLSTVFSGSAGAWTGQLDKCSDNSSGWTVIGAISYFNETVPVNDRINVDETVYGFMYKDPSGTPDTYTIAISHDRLSIGYREDWQQNRVRQQVNVQSANSYYQTIRVPIDKNDTDYPYGWTTTTNAGERNISGVTCYVDSYDLEYEESYTDEPLEDNSSGDPESGSVFDGFRDCEGIFDIGCLTENVIYFFTNIPSIVTEVFLGSIDGMFGVFETFASNLKDKLGFLTYPFEFINSYFATLSTNFEYPFANPTCVNTNTHTYPSSCKLTFTMMNTNVNIDFGMFERELPTLWNMITIIIRFVFFIGCIEMLRSAYYRTVRA